MSFKNQIEEFKYLIENGFITIEGLKKQVNEVYPKTKSGIEKQIEGMKKLIELTGIKNGDLEKLKKGFKKFR